jgi:hypothetical protein
MPASMMALAQLSTKVNDEVRAAEMQEDAKGVQSDAAADRMLPGAAHVTRPDDRIGNANRLLLLHDLVLFDLETIRVLELRMPFDLTIHRAAVALRNVYTAKELMLTAPQASVPRGVEDIARRDN